MRGIRPSVIPGDETGAAGFMNTWTRTLRERTTAGDRTSGDGGERRVQEGSPAGLPGSA
ncbi:hypothetical protein ACWCQZ_06630 [Streptomyces sp. NPDC002285]